MSSKHSSYGNRQYDPSGIKYKINHHEFLEGREEGNEYAAFNLERFKGDLMDKFIRDTEDIASENDRIKSDAEIRLEEYERSHINERDFDAVGNSVTHQRRTIAESITTSNQDFDRATKEATGEK